MDTSAASQGRGWFSGLLDRGCRICLRWPFTYGVATRVYVNEVVVLSLRGMFTPPPRVPLEKASAFFKGKPHPSPASQGRGNFFLALRGVFAAPTPALPHGGGSCSVGNGAVVAGLGRWCAKAHPMVFGLFTYRVARLVYVNGVVVLALRCALIQPIAGSLFISEACGRTPPPSPPPQGEGGMIAAVFVNEVCK